MLDLGCEQSDKPMPFGKRTLARARSAKQVGTTAEQQLQLKRWEDLGERFGALFAKVGLVADAVRGEAYFDMPSVADELDALAGPLDLKGIHECFSTAGPDGLRHITFAYEHPTDDLGSDPNAQFHLQQLIGQALAFNLYCQRAHLDEALKVALQAPEVPSTVDKLLVGAAFFSAMFENMVEFASRDDGLMPEWNAGRQRATLSRHLLMAQDKMLAPERLDALTPMRGWPFVGLELLVAPHDGDCFINGVYFSADQARRILDHGKNTSKELSAVA